MPDPQHLKRVHFFFGFHFVFVYYENKGRDNSVAIREKCGPRWEVVICVSEGQFQQVSFVNGITTIKGGTHVSHVTDQLVTAVLDKVDKKNKGGMDIKPFHVRNHLWVFVNSLIENPAFDSQTKETLTTKQSKFGSKCELSDSTINKVVKSGVVDLVLSWAQAKQNVELGRKMGAKTANAKHINVPKLEDANEAGGKNSERCTLILTEGDSAKALAGLTRTNKISY